jgi:cell division septation protein DedD
MSVEPTPLSCPLCRRRWAESSSGPAPGTRLCHQCQSMVLSAFRGSISNRDSIVAGQNQAIAEASSNPTADEYSLIGATEFGEDIPPVLSSPTDNPDIPQFDQFETHEDSSFRFFEDEDREYEDREYQAHSPGDHLSSDPNNGHLESSPHSLASLSVSDERAEEAAAKPLLEHSKLVQDNMESCVGIKPPADPNTKPEHHEDPEAKRLSVAENEVADPWVEPLPAWDHSQNEWPVLVGPSKRRVQKPRAAVAALVILVVLALSYFLIYRPANAERRTTENGIVASSAETHMATSVAAEEPKQAALPPSDNNSRSTSTASVSAPAQSVYENKNAEGKFSLQAAAFPNESGANEYAEKLKQAGVPSYVVPADVAHRGRWFRVRVGRFNSAEDAQRFAREAQLRAKTGGLALQLIVCQYGQP